MLRMSAADVIGDAGFDVVEAGDADEAIVILEARPDIHIVFTDIQMPGSMDGLKLAGLSGADGRRSRSSRPPASSVSETTTCPKAAASCQSPTARSKSSRRCAI
jgi:CheY-like chemotaxis protein